MQNYGENNNGSSGDGKVNGCSINKIEVKSIKVVKLEAASIGRLYLWLVKREQSLKSKWTIELISTKLHSNYNKIISLSIDVKLGISYCLPLIVHKPSVVD